MTNKIIIALNSRNPVYYGNQRMSEISSHRLSACWRLHYNHVMNITISSNDNSLLRLWNFVCPVFSLPWFVYSFWYGNLTEISTFLYIVLIDSYKAFGYQDESMELLMTDVQFVSLLLVLYIYDFEFFFCLFCVLETNNMQFDNLSHILRCFHIHLRTKLFDNRFPISRMIDFLLVCVGGRLALFGRPKFSILYDT